MNTIRIRMTGVALLATGALGLLLAPIHARADTGMTERHEIPPFVLERTELASGAKGARG